MFEQVGDFEFAWHLHLSCKFFDFLKLHWGGRSDLFRDNAEVSEKDVAAFGCCTETC